MPVNKPQEPLELSEAERLRAARRAEREEARRQKKELARIEHEMRGPGPRWLLPVVLGGVALLAVLVFGAYRVWAGTVVENARGPFDESMNKADKALLGTYATGDWQRVLDLERQAKTGKGGPRAVAKLYRQADELLAGGVHEAQAQGLEKRVDQVHAQQQQRRRDEQPGAHALAQPFALLARHRGAGQHVVQQPVAAREIQQAEADTDHHGQKGLED